MDFIHIKKSFFRAFQSSNADTQEALNSKRFNFKIMNGEAVEYNSAQPLVDADLAIGYEEFMPEDANNILTNSKDSSLVKNIYPI